MIERAAAALTRWSDIIEQRLIADGVPRADAAALAMLVLTSFEGAIVVARATRDLKPLDLVAGQLASLIDARTGTRRK